DFAWAFDRLYTAYEGPVLRVRRSSDDVEADIGTDASGLFDEAAYNAHVGGGDGFAAQVYDQSGNSRNAAQATLSAQPQIILNAVNGRPALRFDGGDHLATANIAWTSTFSMAAIAKRSSGDAGILGGD